MSNINTELPRKVANELEMYRDNGYSLTTYLYDVKTNQPYCTASSEYARDCVNYDELLASAWIFGYEIQGANKFYVQCPEEWEYIMFCKHEDYDGTSIDLVGRTLGDVQGEPQYQFTLEEIKKIPLRNF